MSKRIVITGIGNVCPTGDNKEALWEAVRKGVNCCHFEDELSGSSTPLVAGKVLRSSIKQQLSPRLLKKLDDFSSFAIKASMEAIEDSGLDLAAVQRERVGIVIGNNYGGWEYVMPQIEELYGKRGFDAINSYLATAWFPTAPQGEISIYNTLLGYSKTISADKASSAIAIMHAIQTIVSDRLDIAVVGGTEAPITPLIYESLLSEGIISPNGTYNFLSESDEGCLIGEGASFLILEELEHALDRGARIYAELTNVGIGCDFDVSMEKAMLGASEPLDSLDYVMLDASGNYKWDIEELHAIQRLLHKNDLVESNHAPLKISAPKVSYGNLIGAAAATDVAIACLAIAHSEIPPTCQKELPVEMAGIQHVTQTSVHTKINKVLINCRDFSGQCLSIQLSAISQSG